MKSHLEGLLCFVTWVKQLTHSSVSRPQPSCDVTAGRGPLLRFTERLQCDHPYACWLMKEVQGCMLPHAAMPTGRTHTCTPRATRAAVLLNATAATAECLCY
jgi:hypothetical protein